MTAQTVLKTQDISKSYGKQKVLVDVDLDVKEGEIFGLLGPNGAGKSTVMKILNGLISQDKGKAVFFGKFNPKEIELRKKVAFVPQEDSFYRFFSVEENLSFFGSLYGIGGKELKERIEFLLEWLNLSFFRKRKAEHLSGGYRKMLNIACSLVYNPSFIFLDEPTVGLDPDMRRLLWKKLIELKEKKKTLFITTHYMDEAQELCNRIALILEGKIIVCESPEKLIDKYGGERNFEFEVDKPITKKLETELTKALGNTFHMTNQVIHVSYQGRNEMNALSKINNLIKLNGFAITKTTIKEPDLENVFLNLTGKVEGIKNVQKEE
ncbi:ABC transporter ATP-binding protein [Candidatus Micrarchaeota archaeon]|nr:ABC transporter ATP-binding protein [Candidatus Micrarchaeota archaeon]MBU2476298.1 ABC transporter ATP-binding protein [Candidatus Micrarchaeota archaeon]